MIRALVLGAGIALMMGILPAHDDQIEPPVARLTMLHGNIEPFAMAGYRMGEAAMSKVLLKRGSTDTEVVFHAPAAEPLSAVIDGLQAATGASLGKLNLKYEVTRGPKAWVVVKNKKSGRLATVELLPQFVSAYGRTPEAKMNLEGLKVMNAAETTIFSIH